MHHYGEKVENSVVSIPPRMGGDPTPVLVAARADAAQPTARVATRSPYNPQEHGVWQGFRWSPSPPLNYTEATAAHWSCGSSPAPATAASPSTVGAGVAISRSTRRPRSAKPSAPPFTSSGT